MRMARVGGRRGSELMLSLALGPQTMGGYWARSVMAWWKELGWRFGCQMGGWVLKGAWLGRENYFWRWSLGQGNGLG